VIFQHSDPERGEISAPVLARALPFWLVLMVFEAALWLLLALKFRQPCAPVALAVGLVMGLAVRLGGLRGFLGAFVALTMTALTCTAVLYGIAAFHAARVLGMSPLESLAETGIGFAWMLLDGLLITRDWWFIAGGFVLSVVFGFGTMTLTHQAASTR
jgi:hypothetical protein